MDAGWLADVISAWGLTLLVQLQWAMLEPLCVGRVTRQYPRFFYVVAQTFKRRHILPPGYWAEALTDAMDTPSYARWPSAAHSRLADPPDKTLKTDAAAIMAAGKETMHQTILFTF